MTCAPELPPPTTSTRFPASASGARYSAECICTPPNASRPGTAGMCAGAPLAAAGLQQKASVRAPDGVYVHRALHGKAVVRLVPGQVVDRLVAGGIRVLAAGHQPPRQRAEARGREQAQAVPRARPRAA